MSAYLQRARHSRMRVHALRHSAAAILITAGMPAKAVSQFLGHSRVAFSLQVYDHLEEELRQQTGERMRAVRGPLAKSQTSDTVR
ncbi:MAG: tyrosine-type recombinase/integrase [Bryobacteraceae bacterium]|nr:tyrosine-type recombinase/integrase [Bryobacteraceae bacterium]